MSLPQTQTAIAYAGIRQPLIAIDAPVYTPVDGEVVIHVKWTASSPVDLHSSDGGAMISNYPHLSGGGGSAGTIAAIGTGDVKGLQVGDNVTSFAWRGGKEANHQEYMTVPSYLVSKIPQGMSLEEAVTVPVNLVSAMHAVTKDLQLELPWPLEKNWKPKNAETPILIWGAGSSVGIYLLQVLRHWRYTNVLAVASGKHQEYLLRLGARAVFDYRQTNVIQTINDYQAQHGSISHVIDCIGSLEGTMKPLTNVAQPGSTVAIMMPIIVTHSSDTNDPVYGADVHKYLIGQWKEGVQLSGIRTHYYLDVSLSRV